jgi:GT2 family glycosyltransferase
VDISILICTYNRADYLADTLSSLFELRGLQERRVEVLVVNNNSTDTTEEVTAGFQRRYGDMLRLIRETRQGLSCARNRGIDESSGRIVAFVDDDVLFDRDWLKNLEAAFHGSPDVAAVGGKAILKFELPRPDWVTDEILPAFSAVDLGEEATDFAYPDHPFGCNMAFRREVFDRVGRFAPEMGRVGNLLISNEEKDLFYRISKAGLRVIYWPGASLQHRVVPARIDREFVNSRYFWQGVSDVIFQQMTAPSSRLGLLRKAGTQFRHTVRVVRGSNWSPRRIWWNFKALDITSRSRVSYRAGFIRQALSEAVSLRSRVSP